MNKYCTHDKEWSKECLLCFGFSEGVKEDSLLHFVEFMRRKMTKSYGRKKCQSCKGRADGYMIKNPLWRQIRKSDKADFLCLLCVEHRLGRPLKLEDFTDCVLNYGIGGFDCRSYVEYSKLP